jgi:hypothetical protein
MKFKLFFSGTSHGVLLAEVIALVEQAGLPKPGFFDIVSFAPLLSQRKTFSHVI